MDATAEINATATREDYRSRPGALIWFFRKSRNRWKSKYQALKATVKGFKNQIAAVTKSREQWRAKAERVGEHVTALETENAALRAQIAALEEKKKTDQAGSLLMLTAEQRHVPRGQHYAVGVVLWFVSVVLTCGASLRCAASVLQFFASASDQEGMCPDRSTGRLWLLRIGLAALLRPKVIATDWVWMIDHSVQIGQCKCLVILGIRLSEFPEGRPLCHQDMELIALVPMTNSTKQTMAVCLEETVDRTGVPRAILDDHGADLHGGAEIFRKAHPETIELYDIKHKAACLLKARLEGDERWKSYANQLGQAKFALQQTELAFLTPPSQRSKARFMNLGGLVDWGRKTLALVDDPSVLERMKVSAERVQAKLGWLREFRAELEQWSAYQKVIDEALEFVRRQGLYPGVGFGLAKAMPARPGAAGALREELIDFVRGEGLKARYGERLPGTTEVLESCLGKLKALEDGQSKSGFTGLVLSLGAMVSKWTEESLSEALEQCRVRDVIAWCRQKLGESVQSKRNRAYGHAEGATGTG
jgi:Basic region leucine zipper